MIEWVELDSQCLKGFPMQDPTRRKFPVYLPPGYSKMNRYPSFYLLAGYSGKGAIYIAEDSAFGPSLPERFDKAILEKRLPPCVIVFPDCTSKFGCSQYLNSPAIGHYMDYLCNEIVPFIDSQFSTLSDRESRGVAGHSSGGFGALITGMMRPDLFSVVCSSAGDSFFKLNMPQLIVPTVAEIQKAGSIEAFIKKFFEYPSAKNISQSAFECMMALQLAACYAPNLKNPPVYGDFFFDLKTGEMIPEILEKYYAWDPVNMVDRHEAELKQLSFVLLESGSDDEFGLQLGHRQIAQKLARLQVPHALKEYPGRHSGHHWRFEERLIQLSKSLAV